MTTERYEKLRDALETIAKAAKDAAGEGDFEYRIQSDLAYNLAAWTCQMAESAVKAMLEGDDAAMRRYLQCQEGGGWTGRSDGACVLNAGNFHPVIHGTLFETGAVELRHKIVDAHAELLKGQRILDLEDQVKSLVGQVRKLEARLEEAHRNRQDGF